MNCLDVASTIPTNLLLSDRKIITWHVSVPAPVFLFIPDSFTTSVVLVTDGQKVPYASNDVIDRQEQQYLDHRGIRGKKTSLSWWALNQRDDKQ